LVVAVAVNALAVLTDGSWKLAVFFVPSDFKIWWHVLHVANCDDQVPPAILAVTALVTGRLSAKNLPMVVAPLLSGPPGLCGSWHVLH
jgi:hypothetical protein